MNLNSSLKDLELLKRFATLTGDPSNQKRVENAEREFALAARFTKLTGRPPPAAPPAIRPVPSLPNGPVNARSSEQQVRAHLARLLRADPQNVKEIARVQGLLPSVASTSFGTYPLPSSARFEPPVSPTTSTVSLAGYDPALYSLSITFPKTMTRADESATTKHVLAAIDKHQESIAVPAGVTITLTPVANSSSPAGGAGAPSSALLPLSSVAAPPSSSSAPLSVPASNKSVLPRSPETDEEKLAAYIKSIRDALNLDERLIREQVKPGMKTPTQVEPDIRKILFVRAELNKIEKIGRKYAADYATYKSSRFLPEPKFTIKTLLGVAPTMVQTAVDAAGFISQQKDWLRILTREGKAGGQRKSTKRRLKSKRNKRTRRHVR